MLNSDRASSHAFAYPSERLVVEIVVNAGRNDCVLNGGVAQSTKMSHRGPDSEREIAVRTCSHRGPTSATFENEFVRCDTC